MANKNFEEKLKAALKLDLIDPLRVLHEGRAAGVLVLIGFTEKGNDPQLLITRRTDTLEKHKGQYAFPGGTHDPEDDLDLGIVTTALRETEEETGISRDHVRVLGLLPKLWTPTGFQITPVLAVLDTPIETTVLSLSADETAEVFWVALSTLTEPGIYRQESMQYGNVSFPIHVFMIAHHRVWGATGAIIKNLLDRLRSLV